MARTEELRKLHSPTEEGIWEIRGEDPNCDMGGIHSQPLLGYIQGCYEDVVNYAITLDGFFAWGIGGSITKINAEKIPKGLTSNQYHTFNMRKAALAKLTKEEKEILGIKE